jgi:hypothetical protein
LAERLVNDQLPDWFVRGVGGRTSVTTKNEHHKSLAEYSELSGVTISELLDEGLEDYIHAVISTGVEYMADKAANT